MLALRKALNRKAGKNKKIIKKQISDKETEISLLRYYELLETTRVKENKKEKLETNIIIIKIYFLLRQSYENLT